MGIRIRAAIPRVSAIHAYVVMLCAFASIALNSCGFALRTESISEQVSSVYVSDDVPRDARIAIEREAQRLGIELRSANLAQIRLVNLNETLDERSSRLDSLGRVREYRLIVVWEVPSFGPNAIPVTLSATENVALDEQNLIGYEKERQRTLDVLRQMNAFGLLQEISLLMNSPLLARPAN